jgi:ABC-type phosphate/phosphonate transport system ATPase subunit
MNFNFNDIVMQEALHNDPEFLVIVGKQKTGKSTILAELSRKHNFLILDTQSGYNKK